MNPSDNNLPADLLRLRQTMTDLIQEVYYGECREKGEKVRAIFDEYVFKNEANTDVLKDLSSTHKNRFITLRNDYKESKRQQRIKDLFISILQGFDPEQKPYDIKHDPLPPKPFSPAAATPPATSQSLNNALKGVVDQLLLQSVAQPKLPLADQRPPANILDADYLAALELHETLNAKEAQDKPRTGVQDPIDDMALYEQMQAEWDADDTKDPVLVANTRKNTKNALDKPSPPTSIYFRALAIEMAAGDAEDTMMPAAASKPTKKRSSPEREEITLASDQDSEEEVDSDTLLARQLQQEEEEAAALPGKSLVDVGRHMHVPNKENLEITPQMLALLDTGKRASDDQSLYIADLGISIPREPKGIILQNNDLPSLKMYPKDKVVVLAGTTSKLIEGSEQNHIKVERDCKSIEINGIKNGRVEVEGSSITINNATNCKIYLNRVQAAFQNVTGCTIYVSKDSEINMPDDLHNKNTIID
ncbi:MAG: hypothetical protein LLG04_17335 [Parachlamydia sp.]|nr:hypothetical protein [Parachlamydia sp.]